MVDLLVREYAAIVDRARAFFYAPGDTISSI